MRLDSKKVGYYFYLDNSIFVCNFYFVKSIFPSPNFTTELHKKRVMVETSKSKRILIETHESKALW